MNDDQFLYDFREEAPDAFGRDLYAKLNSQESPMMTYLMNGNAPKVAMFPVVLKHKRENYLTLVAAVVLTLLVCSTLIFSIVPKPESIVSLASNDDAQPESLVVISPENMGQLTELTHFGDGSLNTLKWSPDGTMLAVGGTTGVWLYNDALKLAAKFDLAEVNQVEFSANGRWLAAGTDRGLLAVWDTTDNAQILSTQAHGDYVRGIAFSPDGNWLFTGGYDRTFAVWDIQSGTEKARIAVESDLIALALSPDGTKLVTAEGHMLVAWSVGADGTLTKVRTYPRENRATGIFMAFTADGDQLVIYQDAIITVYDASDIALLTLTLLDGKNPRNVNQFFAVHTFERYIDGQHILIGDHNEGLFLLDTQTMQLTSLYPEVGSSGDWTRVAFHPDGQHWATLTHGAKIGLWEKSDDPTPLEVASTRPVMGWFNSMAANPQNVFAGTTIDGRLYLMDGVTGEEIALTMLDVREYRPMSLVFNASGDRLVAWGLDTSTASPSYRITIVDVAKALQGEPDSVIAHYQADEYWVSNPAFIADNKLFFLAPHTAYEWAYNLDSQPQEVGFRDYGGWLLNSTPVEQFAMSPDGKSVVLVSGAFYKVVDLQTGGTLFDDRIGDHFGRQFALYSKDGEVLFVADGAQRILALNAETGEQIAQLDFEDAIYGWNDVALSPDGGLLVVASYDGVRYWDIRDVNKIGDGVKLAMPTRGPLEIMFSADGKRLYMKDDLVRVWGVRE